MTDKQNERCAVEIEAGRTIKLAPKTNAEQLNEQQLADYKEYRYEFIEWLLREGKNPSA